MVTDDLQRQSSGSLRGSVLSTSVSSAKKQAKLRRNSAGAHTTSKAVISRKSSSTEHVNSKVAPGLAVASMRKSVSQDAFTKDASTDNSLQRPSKPLQIPIQLPLQLPAGKAQLAAVSTRKWLKIAADGTTSILQASLHLSWFGAAYHVQSAHKRFGTCRLTSSPSQMNWASKFVICVSWTLQWQPHTLQPSSAGRRLC